jgi:hypothetical protein
MFKKDFKIILGNWLNGEDGLSEPFNKKKINFLDEISKEILNDGKLNIYPDLKDFGFWCRKKNMKRYQKNFNDNLNLIGRGIALHIPPSNVPMNLAFTMAIGIISGCENFIRIPEKDFPQTNSLLKIVKKVLSNKNFRELKKSLCFIKYVKSDLKSSKLSKISDVRLIWGGDSTVKKFKEYDTKTKNVDLYFPNKISGSLININELKKLKSHEFANLVYKFYIDAYLMDQKGCSSPKIIFWYGKNIHIKKKFYEKLRTFITNKYQLDFSRTSDKLYLLSELAIKNTSKIKTKLKNIDLVTIDLKKPPNYNLYNNLAYGIFFSVNIKNLNIIKNYISENFQTLSYFGFDRKTLINLIVKKRFKGIDRIVPIGSAFEMNLVWDGYDLIKSMTRSIS